jgi:phytoene/squalene synthetase
MQPMSDPFNLLGPELGPAPRFDDAVRDAVAALEAAASRFDSLRDAVPADAYRPEEWRIVARTAAEVEEAAELAEEGFLAAQFDSHAWYRVMENLQRVARRLESAAGIMEEVARRAPNGEHGRAPLG